MVLPAWVAPVVEGPAAAVVAVGEGRKEPMITEGNMKSRLSKFRTRICFFVVILVAPRWVLPGIAAAQAQSETQAVTTVPKAFDSPQQAAEALINAAGAYDVPELMAIFGSVAITGLHYLVRDGQIPPGTGARIARLVLHGIAADQE